MMNEEHADLANRLRETIQSQTPTIADGEMVAMLVLWSFASDHARVDNLDLDTYAREMWTNFADFAVAHVRVTEPVLQ